MEKRKPFSVLLVGFTAPDLLSQFQLPYPSFLTDYHVCDSLFLAGNEVFLFVIEKQQFNTLNRIHILLGYSRQGPGVYCEITPLSTSLMKNHLTADQISLLRRQSLFCLRLDTFCMQREVLHARLSPPVLCKRTMAPPHSTL